MRTSKLEIACFNLESALIAAKAGADRIELCCDFASGGLTPDAETIRLAREQVSVDLLVMIRPRSGNFTYTASEFEAMKNSIEEIKKFRVNGFVFGILNEDNTVNMQQNRELVELATPFSCTFHRAFDSVRDPLQALEDVINCGFSTILTSGCETNAVDGMNGLVQLTEAANGRITIMPGGGVRASNISLFNEKINPEYIHSSAIKANDLADAGEIQLLKEKLKPRI